MIKIANNSVFEGVVYLIGFMAGGKTLTGRLLANRLNVPFIDLDTELQIMEGKAIAEIFNNQGEDHFRSLETYYLKRIDCNNSFIISVGGGTPFYHNNMEYMNANGVTIYLDTPFEVIHKRLENNKNYRPLASNMDINMLKSLYEKRLPIYRNAHKIFIHNEQQTIEDQIEHILKLIM